MDKQVFPGNTDQFSTVTHSLDNIKDVLYVRLEVKSWHQQICMRVELFGCDGKLQLLSFVIVLFLTFTMISMMIIYIFSG